ncbi:MAG TPA: hypothetical protein VJA27_03420 [Patescibacteria group bacterium]|nr:hypothetical protein [Patescibacteria group bacterium]
MSQLRKKLADVVPIAFGVFGLAAILFFVGSIVYMVWSTERTLAFRNNYEVKFDYTTARAITTKNPEVCLDLIPYKYYHIDLNCDDCYARVYRNECLAEFLNQYPDPSLCKLFSFISPEEQRVGRVGKKYLKESCESRFK